MRLPAIIIAGVLAATFFAADSPKAKAQTPDNQPAESITVEIKPGDTLIKIATAHQTTYQRLFNANLEIKDPDIIYPGDKVRIPKPEEQLTRRDIPADVTVVKPMPKQNIQRKRSQHTPTIVSVPASGDVWDRLAQCESGGNWRTNTGNGYYGGLQFTPGSWRAVGGSGTANQASREEQIARAKQLQARQGWGAWPACSRKLGLR